MVRLSETRLVPDARDQWNTAVALLGGGRAAAAALDMNESTMRALMRGARPLHTGFVADMVDALDRHRDASHDAARTLAAHLPEGGA